MGTLNVLSRSQLNYNFVLSDVDLTCFDNGLNIFGATTQTFCNFSRNGQ